MKSYLINISLIISYYISECGIITWQTHGTKIGQGYAYVAHGKLAAPKKWRWMAAILIEDKGSFYQYCGGSLVSDQHIVTAAHCLADKGKYLSSESVIVRLGQYDLRNKGQDFKVDSYVIHPGFNNKTFKYDVAVLKLMKKVEFTDEISVIKPVIRDMSYNFEKEDDNEIAYIAGWGRTSHQGQFSDDLQEATLHIVPQTECNDAFKKYVNITDHYLCAKAPEYEPEPSDACQGDSGGPFVQYDVDLDEYYLTGVISFGKKCGTYGVPGVYTRVETFCQWIHKMIKYL